MVTFFVADTTAAPPEAIAMSKCSTAPVVPLLYGLMYTGTLMRYVYCVPTAAVAVPVRLPVFGVLTMCTRLPHGICLVKVVCALVDVSGLIHTIPATGDAGAFVPT